MVVTYFTGIRCNSILFNKLTFTQTSHFYPRRSGIKGYRKVTYRYDNRVRVENMPGVRF